jgi:hypothetical protein
MYQARGDNTAVRPWYAVPVLIIPLFLAGCAVVPGGSSPSSAPDANAVATQVAAAVQATIAAALGPVSTAKPSDPPATSRGGPAQDPRSPTVTHSTTVPTTVAGSSSTPGSTGTPLPSATPVPSVTSTATVTAAPTPVVLAPRELAEQEIGGGKLLPHYWTNTPAIVFSMAAAPGNAPAMRPEVEVRPIDRPFTGNPTAEGAVMTPGKPGTVTINVGGLAEGAYHWQGRLSDGAGHDGPWVDYYAGPAFRLDRTPPAAPVISSTTHPDQKATYSEPVAKMSWTKPLDVGGVQGYMTSVDRDPAGVPTGTLTGVTTTSIGPLANGTIYFHVRAEDWAGNLGKIATFVLHIDHTAPDLGKVVFDRFQFNPQFDHLSMHFVPNKAVTVKVEIHQQTTKGLVRVMTLGKATAGKKTTVSWDGRDQKGVLVQPGNYTMIVYLTDTLGNVGDGYYSGLTVNYRRIVVHLSTQSMDVYDGSTLLRSTLVTTGNNMLPTPVGIWHIGAKFHPYTFLSPWKKGSVYYYPPSKVNYALYFHSGGYFIHDAPWRTVYGPGTNNQPGPPGAGEYSGTHGCVNVPIPFEQWLYHWAQIGTVVQVKTV